MRPLKTITSAPPSTIEFLNPIRMFSQLLRMRGLIVQFAWREFEGKYKGSYLGLVWAVLNPLMSFAVYYFVFGIVLQARFPAPGTEGQDNFALTLFCGIVVFNVFSVCALHSPLSIANKANFVKKVVFPLEVLPVAVLGASLISGIMGLAILIAALLVFTGGLSPTIYLFPLVLIPLCALSLGVGWFLSSIGIFLRDLGQVVAIVVQLLFFLSPVIYPLSAVPESFQLIMRLNPLTTILEDSRRILVAGLSPEWGWWVVVTLVCLIVMQSGYVWFMKMKRYFSDVL